jgi:hypothetical protein
LKELFKEKQELPGCEEVINYNVNIKWAKKIGTNTRL